MLRAPRGVSLSIAVLANGIVTQGGKITPSGGDVRFVELAKRWIKRGCEIHVVTTEEGLRLCRALGLDANYHLVSSQWGPTALRYLLRAAASPGVAAGEIKADIVYTTSDLLCDVLPAARLRVSRGVSWAAVVHWVERGPWDRGLRLGLAWVNGALLVASQRISMQLARRWACVVLAVSNTTARELIRLGFRKSVVRSVKCGVNCRLAEEVSRAVSGKEYDGCFMKRFHSAKGVFDVIAAWRLVCERVPDAKLVMVGHGPAHVLSRVRRLIRSYGLEGNVELLGPIYDERRKFEVLSASKLLVHPSYEENWAIVIGEALACGVPVVAYDLPALREVWGQGVVMVPKGDVAALADSVARLLVDEGRLVKLGAEGRSYVARYDWDIVADEELRILMEAAGVEGV